MSCRSCPALRVECPAIQCLTLPAHSPPAYSHSSRRNRYPLPRRREIDPSSARFPSDVNTVQAMAALIRRVARIGFFYSTTFFLQRTKDKRGLWPLDAPACTEAHGEQTSSGAGIDRRAAAEWKTHRAGACPTCPHLAQTVCLDCRFALLRLNCGAPHLTPTDLMLSLCYPPEADLLRHASPLQV